MKTNIFTHHASSFMLVSLLSFASNVIADLMLQAETPQIISEQSPVQRLVSSMNDIAFY